MADSVSSQLSIASESAGGQLPPGRWEELLPRLATLLADFDKLEQLEAAELEPIPAFHVEQDDDDARA